MIQVSIIIVTYNSAKHINGLLDSIARSNLDKEVIVVDNASADKSAAIARRHKLKPKVIANATNVGFAKAVNQGLRQAQGEYILLQNPDTRLIGRALVNLYEFAKKQTLLGAVAPRLVDPDGRSQPSVFHFPTIINAFRRYFFGQKERYGKYLPPAKISKVDVAVMAAFLFPRANLESVGFLDERFFLYYEDIEFCRRLKQHHLPIYYLPTAKVMHVHGASGHFRSHHNSPLLKSAIIYHGPVYFSVLNLVLWLGQKLEILKKRRSSSIFGSGW